VKIWLKIALNAVRLPKFEQVNGISWSLRKIMVKDLRQRSGLAWFCTRADSCVVFNTGLYTDLPDNSIIADPWYSLTCQISSRSVYSAALWRRKPPMCAIFLTSAFCGIAIWQQSEKVEHRCTTTDLPLSNGIQRYPTVSKSFLYSNAFMAKSGAQTLTFKSVTNRQTDKQTKILNVFGRPGGEWNASPTKLVVQC